MGNEFLDYYGKYNISPVHQNIDDFNLHMTRRKKLYRQLGMPIKLFRDARVLEIGPGGGYNTLCFFQWGAKHIDLVEANKAGIDNMRENFALYGIDASLYDIFETKIENFSSENYDIIIAEGFLQYLSNSGEIVKKLKGMANESGIIVVTCADDFGDFVETMKRMIAHSFIKEVSEHNERVKILSHIFEPQLKSLQGVSRPVEDWVQDQFLNPALTNGVEWTIANAIEDFSPEFETLGCSPHMFSDWSWYKNIWYDMKTQYLAQYKMRRFSLFLAGMEERAVDPDIVAEIDLNVRRAKHSAREYEISYDNTLFLKASEDMESLCHLVQDIDPNLHSVFCQIRDAFRDINEAGICWNRYPDLFKAFGRGMQYVGFVRQ
ncbi:MAG: methyltransferase domain-containing protein [Fretibacterium sp.]|nr:methyltransferase domain-containing protein [Fretibacterium sp.]